MQGLKAIAVACERSAGRCTRGAQGLGVQKAGVGAHLPAHHGRGGRQVVLPWLRPLCEEGEKVLEVKRGSH